LAGLFQLASLAQAVAETDGVQLLKVKASFSNGNTVLESWMSGTDPCGTTPKWLGIPCNEEGRVTAM
jgi:hypothetical protein